MAGEAGAAVLQGLAQNLVDLTKNQISLIYGLDGEAQNLIQNLDTIQQFLNDAETQTTIPSGDVKSWLLRLENPAFEADNVLDEIHYRDLSKTIDKKETVLISCFSFFIDYVRKRNSAVSIQKINMNLKSIHESATQLGLQQKNAVARTAPYAGVETDSISADPIFIGRDEVVSEIVATLISSVSTHDERVFSILPIVGMGGLGKTTLTRKLFHHQNMESQFGSRIWVHVSQVFDPINLFKKILQELISSLSDEGESKQRILKKLQGALKDKTYLLVLDDVWNDDVSKWEVFLNSLSGVTNTKGNGIIVTTRNTEVASIVGTLPIHQLKGLSEEDCWSIIRAKTFGNEGVPLGIELVGREIAKRCGGLPLAASVVGGVLLRCNKSVDNWVSIRDNWLPEGEGEGENNITQILKLSFNNLSSPSLKKCFAYCSIFPKGDKMEKQDLIEMWMGVGFLGSNEDMASVGDKFYNVLLHSSLLQVAKREEYDRRRDDQTYNPREEYNPRGERCVMHDLVHDLASSVLGNAYGVSRVRYLIHKEEEGKSSPIKKEVAQHLRTLIFQAHQPFDDNIFSDFKSLHVLILIGIRTFKELPRSIRKLIHLRNLNISVTGIRYLPDWIGELHHLQTLRAPLIEKLPSTIKYLINLRHLHAPLPAEIGRLTSLQTLWREFMVQDKNGYTIEELGSLNNLKGLLHITCLEKVHGKEEAEKANLSKKSKLSKLLLVWNANRGDVESINDENVLDGLQPHSNLKKLSITGFNGKRFPEWTLKMAVRNEPQGSWIGLNHLVEIRINLCRECEEIPMLGHLPNLKSLSFSELRNVKSINSSFYGIGNETVIVFPALETLSLFSMDSLKEWAEVESGSTSEVKVFPNLQTLVIMNCYQLTSNSYLNLLTSLTDIFLFELNGLESLPDELFYNNPHLSALKIMYCRKLREIPDGLQTLNYLEHLIIDECPDLKRIGCSSRGSLASLAELRITKCHGLMDIPYEMVESLSALVLKKVELGRLSSLRNLPTVIECLAKSAAGLKELRIVGVPIFMATSVDQVWHFPNLIELKIHISMEGSSEASFATVDRILQGCSCDSLGQLSLEGMESWECLPESIQHLTSLRRLELINFGMEELPEWFVQYISHTKSRLSLGLYECKRLRRQPSTPAMRLLIEQNKVYISGCLKLQQQSSPINELP